MFGDLPSSLLEPRVIAVYGVVPDQPERAGTRKSVGCPGRSWAILAVSEKHLRYALEDCVEKGLKEVQIPSDTIFVSEVILPRPSRVIGHESAVSFWYLMKKFKPTPYYFTGA